MSKRILVSSAPGLEELLATELRGFGLEPSVEPSGTVALDGSWKEASRILVRSRIASRVSISIRRFSSRNQAMLYDQVRRIDWPEVFSNERSFSIKATGSVRGTDFTLAFAPLKIKDALCDEFRKRGYPRPDVDRQNPDVRLTAFFFQGRCELSIDITGTSLHRRGYRTQGAEAPLRENRAAALLLFSGYDGSLPLVDPFCGSGTIPIEAALIATRTAPGLLRSVDAFSLPGLYPEAEPLLREEYEEARSEQLPKPPCPVRGLDLASTAVEIARSNARRARVEQFVDFRPGDSLQLAAPDSWIVTNPPYGERLEDRATAEALLKEFVHGVKHNSVDSKLGLVIPRDMSKSVGLRPERKLSVESGPLSLAYLLFSIRAGRFHARKSE